MNAYLANMNAVLTDDGKIMLPPELRKNAQLQPGDTLDVQFYKGSIVLRKRQPLTPEQCALLLERSRSQPRPTPEDDLAVEQAVRAVRDQRR
jgi:bifunctional DNA-binding transcriptional regulator/antitoxin component of YhaV-PrlF toxin-antitoxin module